MKTTYEHATQKTGDAARSQGRAKIKTATAITRRSTAAGAVSGMVVVGLTGQVR